MPTLFLIKTADLSLCLRLGIWHTSVAFSSSSRAAAAGNLMEPGHAVHADPPEIETKVKLEQINFIIHCILIVTSTLT